MVHLKHVVKMGSLTMLSSIALALVTLALSGVLFWSIQANQEPYQQLITYTQVSKEVQVSIRKNIDQYLATGDTTQLQQAEQALDGVMQEKIQRLPTAISAMTRARAEAVQEFIQTDLRAAGKLSGDVQGLLHQAEREIAGSLDLLTDYARDGGESSPAAGLQYALAAARGQTILKSLAAAREYYFVSGEPQYLNIIEAQLRQAGELLNGLQSLPRLGIYRTSEENEFANLMGVEATAAKVTKEDKVEAYLNDLRSLFTRYLREIKNTDRLIASRKQTRQRATVLLDDLETTLNDMVALIDHRYNVIMKNSYWVAGSAVALFFLLVVLVNSMQRRFVKAVTHFVPYLTTYSQGDLREGVSIASRFEEIMSLQGAANRLRDQMHNLVGEIQAESENILSVSNRLADAYHVIHDNSKVQEQQTHQSTTAVNQMLKSFRDVARNAGQAAEATNHAEMAVNQGGEVIRETVTTIKQLVSHIDGTAELIIDLEAESVNIEQILLVIEGIAEQTNLLALNAAIEAARAGDQGRGFAVVADEVRQLAHRTTDSTREIKHNIEKLQNVSKTVSQTLADFVGLANATSEQVHRSETRFARIVDEISRIRDMSLLIAAATDEQANVAEAIQQNMVQINEGVIRSVASVEATVEDSQLMAMTSMSLREAVKKFTIM